MLTNMDSFLEMLKWMAICFAACAAIASGLILVAKVVSYLSRNPAAANAFTWLWFSMMVLLDLSSGSLVLALSSLVMMSAILCWKWKTLFTGK